MNIKKHKARIKMLFQQQVNDYNDYKNVLLNNKCIRHSTNRIQSKDHRIGTHEIDKIALSCFDDKLCIQNNGYDRLALEY